MASENTVKILGAISFLLGVHVFISSVVLAYFTVNFNPERLSPLDQSVERKIKIAVASLGIITATIQILLSASLVLNPGRFVRVWLAVEFVCSLMALVCLVLGIHSLTLTREGWLDVFQVSRVGHSPFYFAPHYHNLLVTTATTLYMASSLSDLEF